MSKQFFMHVNNHADRPSIKGLSSNKLKKIQPSYTVAGILEGDSFRFGVSKCSKEDAFHKGKGRTLALAKAEKGELVEIPEYILKNGQLGVFFVTKAKRLIKKL